MDMARSSDPTYNHRSLLAKWLETVAQLGLHWAPTGHTYTSDGKHKDGLRYKSTLDHVYHSSSDSMSSARVLPDATTDHYPVQVDVQLERTRRAATRVTRTERDFRGLDKDTLVLSLLYHDCSTNALYRTKRDNFSFTRGLRRSSQRGCPIKNLHHSQHQCAAKTRHSGHHASPRLCQKGGPAGVQGTPEPCSCPGLAGQGSPKPG